MKMIEATLYKLALKEKISLEQAKILLAIYKKENSVSALFHTTGISYAALNKGLVALEKQKIISKKESYYKLNNIEEKISELIQKETKPITIMNR